VPSVTPYKVDLLTPAQLQAFVDKVISQEGDHEENGANLGSCAIYQRAGGGAPGDSWCMDLQLWALHEAVGFYPLPRSGSCEEQRDNARAAGRLSTDPAYGRVGLVISPVTGKAHHAFVVTSIPDDLGTYDSWAGNTTKDGVSVNGTGCYSRTRGAGDTMIYRYIIV
jgi:hypothetical protein